MAFYYAKCANLSQCRFGILLNRRSRKIQHFERKMSSTHQTNRFEDDGKTPASDRLLDAKKLTKSFTAENFDLNVVSETLYTAFYLLLPFPHKNSLDSIEVLRELTPKFHIAC